MSRPRIRTIKPELWQDEAFGTLSKEARLLFIGLITMADDEGRLRALPSAIVGHVFPYDGMANGKLRKLLAEVESHGLIKSYEIDNFPYIQLPGWEKHQRINRPTPSNLPGPVRENGPKPSDISVSDHGDLTENSSPRAGAGAPADRIGSEGIGVPLPPEGNRARDRHRFEEQVQAYTASLGITHPDGWFNVKGAIESGRARTDDAVIAWVRRFRPDILTEEVAA